MDHELKALVAQLDFSSSSHLNKPSAPPPKIKNSKQKPQEKESEPNHHQPKEHQLTRSKKDTTTPPSKALAPEPSSTADENEARRAKEAAKAVQRRLEAVRAAAATTSKPSLQPDHSHKPRETVASIHSTGTASWVRNHLLSFTTPTHLILIRHLTSFVFCSIRLGLSSS